MKPIRRPRRGETEDDLLAMAQEFQASNAQNSVNIVRCPDPEPSQTSSSKTKINQLDNQNQNPESLNFIQKDIVINKNPTNYSFPEAREIKIPTGLARIKRNKGDKRSLYAIKMGHSQRKTREEPTDSVPKPSGSSFAWQKSILLENSSPNIDSNNSNRPGIFDNESIHHENINRLKNLSHEQLVRERDEMLANLDQSRISELAELLKNRKKLRDSNSGGNVVKKDNSTQKQHQEQPQPPSQIESTWLKNLPDLKDFKTPKDLQEKRFDFTGTLITPETLPKNFKQELHHHGDHQEIPGYTLSELVHLSQSRVLKQRTSSLFALSKIFKKFDGINFNLAIEAFCDNASWFVFRWNLDQAGLVNILASLKCFEEMLSVDNFLEAEFLEYEDVSKKFLVFKPEKLEQKEQAIDNSKEKEPEKSEAEKIAENAKTDFIPALLETQILTRFNYLIEKYENSYINYSVLKILNRLSRHSMQVSSKIFSQAGLLEYLVKYYLKADLQFDLENDGSLIYFEFDDENLGNLENENREEKTFIKNSHGLNLKCFDLLIQLLINLMKTSISLSENVFLTFIKPNFEIFETLAIRGNFQVLRLFTNLIVSTSHINNYVKSIDLMLFHQVLTENSFSVSGNYKMRIVLLHLLENILLVNIYTSNKQRLGTQQELQEQEPEDGKGVENQSYQNYSWPSWFYQFLKSCRDKNEIVYHPTVYRIINLLRSKRPGQLDSNFITDTVSLLRNNLVLNDSGKTLKKKMAEFHDICVNIPRFTFSQELHKITNHLELAKHFIEYERVSLYKEKIDKIEDYILTDNNACLTTNFYNQIICDLFYQKLKYKDPAYLRENVDKTDNNQLLKILIEITLSSNNYEAINFSLNYLAPSSLGQKIFQINFDRSSNVFKFGSTTDKKNVAAQAVLPLDWCMTPIVDQYLKKNAKDHEITNSLKEEFLVSLTILQKIVQIERLPSSLIYNRLLCLCLSCSNPFSGYKSIDFSKIVKSILNENSNLSKNLTIVEPELKSLYISALDQYDAASYNNTTFTEIMLFPFVDGKNFPKVLLTSGVYIELHQILFCNNIRLLRLMSKNCATSSSSTDSSTSTNISPLLPFYKNENFTPILARNVLYFLSQLTNEEYQGRFFEQSVEFLKLVLGDDQVSFKKEQEILRRDARMTRLHQRYFADLY